MDTNNIDTSTPAPAPQVELGAPAPKPSFDYTKLFIPIAIVIAGIVVSATLYMTRAPAQQANQQPQQQIVNIKDVQTANEPYIGQANAPVTMAYWSDFQCPFCKQFETEVLPTLIQNYVNTGKLKIVFKDFQFLDQMRNTGRTDSQIAGAYARAIWTLNPNQYFAWREAMFNKQDNENSGFGDEASIIALTKTISGIDQPAVTAYVKAHRAELQKMTDADRDEGAKFGIGGTPSFIVGNGNPLIQGVAGPQDFGALIDAQLQKK